MAVQRAAQVPQVVEAGGSAGSLAGGLESRQQKRHEHGDHSCHHEQLHERHAETTVMGGSGHATTPRKRTAPQTAAHARAAHGESGCVQQRILDDTRPAASAAVPAIPPSRSGRLLTLVGLLTPRLGRLHAFSRPPRKPQWREAADLDAWSQRRGRPGFAPEFPVCREKGASFARPPRSVAECSGCAEAVKPRRGRPARPQGLPAGVGGVSNLDGRGSTARRTLPVVRTSPTGLTHVDRAAFFTQRAATKHRGKKASKDLKPLSPSRR